MTTAFTARVTQWAIDRNIIGGSTPKDQFLKLVEEIGEAVEALLAGDKEEGADGIGDSAVVAVIIAEQCGIDLHLDGIDEVLGDVSEASLIVCLGQLSSAIQKNHTIRINARLVELIGILKAVADARNLDFDDCCEAAWNEIKNRKGEMRDGIFHKETTNE